jgi:SH3-like domain-containing protein
VFAARQIRTSRPWERLAAAAFLGFLVLAACGSKPRPEPAIDEAFVGPFELEVLAQLSPESEVAAVLRHGERVEILRWRRRFARIRTAGGLEGWTDGRMLLSAAHMARLRQLSMNAARLPSQGRATVYGTLNAHIAPNRQAPSFYQLQEGILTDVVAQRPLPRTEYGAGEETILAPLNSYAGPDSLPGDAGMTDDWALVRLPDGRAGWVLSRLLVMGIPDEVAQYAEGQRITSYFSLGRVEDGGTAKHHWLWTTLARGGRPYQFDSVRVFVWSRTRHRYETAFIERNLVGYYPVEVRGVAEREDERAPPPQFSIIVRERDGSFRRRTYVLEGYRVRLAGGEEWRPPPEERQSSPPEFPEGPPQPGEPFLARLGAGIRGWWARLSGR